VIAHLELKAIAFLRLNPFFTNPTNPFLNADTVFTRPSLIGTCPCLDHEPVQVFI
jgi:hypothetical protein